MNAITSDFATSAAASAEGRAIVHLQEEALAHFRASWTHGEPWRETMEALANLWSECSQPDWDGYGAPALSAEVFHLAVHFIGAIPFDIPAPEISASSAGEISFEWAQTPRRIVSIAISENGEVNFASLNGYKRSFGSLPFDGSFDPQWYDLILSVLD